MGRMSLREEAAQMKHSYRLLLTTKKVGDSMCGKYS